MVSELLHYEGTGEYWAVWQINMGSMLCMFCVVFLGLKFKWFRAQFRLGEAPKSRKISTTVQGVGFKINSNADDFQFYRVSSEFAVPSKSTPQRNKISIKSKSSSNISDAHISNTTNFSKVSIKSTNETSHKKSPLPIPKNIQISNSTETLPHDKFNNESKDSFTTPEQNIIPSPEYDILPQNKTLQVTNPEYDSLPFHAKNPLATQSAVMPDEEDMWKIRIVDEKPKTQTKYEEDDYDNDLMYSSQAASIFFGAKPPVPMPRSPVARKFTEDDDLISIGSDTNA